MPVSRMRMRPWLELKINSNTISGLVWVDKKEKIFSIPWKHAARHGWEVEKDACLFKEWAIHTGKYTEGQTNADPKTWKANFRCAMNSLPDIEEVKDKSVNKGHQAVRVYRMLKVTAKPKDRRSKVKDAKRRSKSVKIKAEEMEYSDIESPADHRTLLHDDTSSTQENTVDSTEHRESTFESAFEVPEWSTSVEIGPDSTSCLYAKFQVSPEHSPEYSDPTEDIIKIAQQLELDTRWMQCGTDNTGFLSYETCTDSYSNSSPASQWSETSSADEVDLPLYTDLVSGLTTSVDDIWSNSYIDTGSWNPQDHNSFFRQIACSL